MRTSVHITLILLVGVLLGLALRPLRRGAAPTPPPDVVFTNAEPADERPPENDEPTRPPEGWMTEFELTERSGEIVSSEDLVGTPYIVSFFFVTCPSTCVQQNQKVRELQEEFQGRPVRFVSISVDPENDTPEALREYAARFGADAEQWLFLTGDLLLIRRVGVEIFRLPVDEKFHTDKFVLVNSEGEIVGYYDWPERKQFQKLKDDIDAMLQKAA